MILRVAFILVLATLPASISAQLPFRDTSGIVPLSEAERSHWIKSSGEWTFEGATLTGVGESEISYSRAFLPPFRVKFDMEVFDGVRPRVYVGNYKLAHEGFSGRHLGFYPAHDKSKTYDYTTGKKIPVQIDITKDKIEVRVSGKLIDTRNIGLATIPPLRFSSGDSYSKGTTRFSNVEITAAALTALPKQDS